jgi:hypothetical protein
MEQLRVIPVAMFLTGVVLIYAGFQGIRPLDVIRNNLGSLSTGTSAANSTTVPYTQSTDPNYAGVTVRSTPGANYGANFGSAGLFTT